MTAIDSVTGKVTQSTPVADALGKTAAIPESKDQYGQDTFLKLLVAQLKYQDPSNPADSTQFMAQTAQFTSLEKMTEMAKVNAEMLAGQKVLSASSMIGRTVTYTDSAGKEATGAVGSVRFEAAGPVLKVGKDDVAMSDVKEVKPTATT